MSGYKAGESELDKCELKLNIPSMEVLLWLIPCTYNIYLNLLFSGRFFAETNNF